MWVATKKLSRNICVKSIYQTTKASTHMGPNRTPIFAFSISWLTFSIVCVPAYLGPYPNVEFLTVDR